MSEKDICRGCGNHCDLREPRCSRGEEYRRTGEMPERRETEHRNDMSAEHCPAADVNGRLVRSLRNLGHIMRMQCEGKASQKRILIILKESGATTQRDLTERLGIQPGSASEILSKLEGAGWIVRTQNEADRRTTDISLTDSGRELAEEALMQRRERHEEMFSCLSEEERQELLALLEKVCADWRTRYGESGNMHGRDHHHHGPHDHCGPHGHCGSHGHDGHGPQGEPRRHREG